MEALNRFVMQKETSDRDMHIHSITPSMTSQNFKQSTIQQFFMSQNNTDSL